MVNTSSNSLFNCGDFCTMKKYKTLAKRFIKSRHFDYDYKVGIAAFASYLDSQEDRACKCPRCNEKIELSTWHICEQVNQSKECEAMPMICYYCRRGFNIDRDVPLSSLKKVSVGDAVFVCCPKCEFDRAISKHECGQEDKPHSELSRYYPCWRLHCVPPTKETQKMPICDWNICGVSMNTGKIIHGKGCPNVGSPTLPEQLDEGNKYGLEEKTHLAVNQIIRYLKEKE